ncbi:armadillo-type protein [Pavlovales sp. CCMP2436]|nr:armadillo-type protein [Pavlovales sp. CCMP2436]
MTKTVDALLRPLYHLAIDGLDDAEEVGKRVAQDVKDFVEGDGRAFSPEAFAAIISDVHRRMQELVGLASPPAERYAALVLLDELIDVEMEEGTTQTTRYANIVRAVLWHSAHVALTDADRAVLACAARALGHITRAGGASFSGADFVDFEARQALEKLRDARSEQPALAAVLVIGELARHAPTLFHAHVPAVLDLIGLALCNERANVRQVASVALRACLLLLQPRDAGWQARWYEQLLGEARDAFDRGSAASTHGGLLVLLELAKYASAQFRLKAFDELCILALSLSLRGSREAAVVDALLQLLPRLAAAAPDLFAARHLRPAVAHLHSLLADPSARAHHAAAYVALAGLAREVRESFAAYLSELTPLLREALMAGAGRGAGERGSLGGWAEDRRPPPTAGRTASAASSLGGGPAARGLGASRVALRVSLGNGSESHSLMPSPAPSPARSFTSRIDAQSIGASVAGTLDGDHSLLSRSCRLLVERSNYPAASAVRGSGSSLGGGRFAHVGGSFSGGIPAPNGSPDVPSRVSGGGGGGSGSVSGAPQLTRPQTNEVRGEALACVGALSKALGERFSNHAASLLESMFAAGLSAALAEYISASDQTYLL